ncbi:MAG: BrnA antitoxin family protein [Alsobacter sp.]
MAKPPILRRPTDPLSVAEAVFKPITPASPEAARIPVKSGVPVAREVVSIRIDSDVLAHFQEDGPGWQDRINDALRQHMARSSDA